MNSTLGCFQAKTKVQMGLRQIGYGLLVLLLLQLLFNPSNASTFRKLRLPEGINMEYNLPYEDSDGLLWLNTTHGIYFFDGIDFTQVVSWRNNNHAVESIAVKGQQLWYVERDQLKRLDLVSGQTHIKPIDMPIKDDYKVTALKIDKNNNVWIGYRSAGLFRKNYDKPAALFRIDANSEIITKVALDTQCMHVSSIALGTDGAVLIATCDGLFRYNHDTKDFTRQNIETPQPHFITSLSVFNQLKVIATPQALFKYDLSSNSYQPITCRLKNLEGNYFIRNVDIYNSDTLAISTQNSTQYCDITSGEIMAFENRSSHHFRDKNNIIWKNRAEGLFYQNAEFPVATITRKNTLFRHSLSSNYISTIFEDSRRRLWVGTSSGVNLIEPNSEQIKHFAEDNNQNSLNGTVVWAIKETPNGDIYIGTDAGVNRLNANEDGFINAKSSPQWLLAQIKAPVWDFVQDQQNNLWIASKGAGLYLLKPGAKQLKNYRHRQSHDNSLTSNSLRNLHINKNQQLWIGTQSGFNRYRPDTDDFVRYPMLNQRYIADIAQDPSGKLLVTKNRNFAQIAPQPIPVTKAFEHPEFPEHVQSMQYDDNGILWIAGAKSLHGYDERNNIVTSIPIDGTHFITGSKAKGHDGTLYFGSLNGMISFKPRKLHGFVKKTRVIFTKVKSENPQAQNALPTAYTYDNNATFVLPPAETGFSVKVAAINYVNPHKVRYKHRLLGYNNIFKEVSADEREVQFTNLAPGNYRFEVKTTDANGQWQDDVTTLRVIRQAYFWQSLWFRMVMMFVVIITLLLLLRWRLSQLGKKAAALEQIVIERTAEIAGQKADIETLLKAKQTLIANVSHEFRTPLTLIQGPTELIASQPSDSALVVKQSKVIKRNTQRLMRMVEHLLAFSKPKIEPQDISPMIPDSLLTLIVEPFELLTQSKQLSFKVALMAPEAAIAIPKDSLEMIVTNLLSNAIKYNREGGSVCIETQMITEGWQLKVSDTGIGMENQHLQQVFERFNRIGGSHHEKIAGAGLGLALVKELVQRYGGTIELHSEFGAGSHFTVVFEQVKQSAALVQVCQINQDQLTLELSEAQQVETAEQTPSVAFSHQERILIVEDNLDMCDYIKAALGPQYHFYTAHDGVAGLEQAREEVPDIIISDVMMPQMDGFEFCRLTKQDMATCHIPVILLTALATSQQKVRGYESLADAYLNKPFNRSELQARVQNLLTIRGLLQKQRADTTPAKMSVKANAKPTLAEKDIKLLEKVNEVIEQNLANCEFSAKDLYNTIAMSERLLQRKLKALIGQTPVERIREKRLGKASELLTQGHHVGKISEMVGFSSHTYFSTCFKARFGISPSEFAR